MHTEPFDRITAYDPTHIGTDAEQKFKFEWHNENFRRSTLTWCSLFCLVIAYPAISILGTDDPTSLLKGLNDSMRLFLFVTTIAVQWMIFMLIYGTTFRENTGLIGIGFKRIRIVDFFWGISFFAAAALILSGLAELLAKIGLPMSGDIKFLIPQDATGRIVWFFLSATAGVCEEAMFRGYVMTRLRLVGNFQNWVIPTLVSTLAFGACHAYQGLPGLIVISVYGAMFSILFIYTKSIWPCVIAHFFQDFLALFIPQ